MDGRRQMTEGRGQKPDVGSRLAADFGIEKLQLGIRKNKNNLQNSEGASLNLDIEKYIFNERSENGKKRVVSESRTGHHGYG